MMTEHESQFAASLPEAREPEPDVVATEDMMTEQERVEADALARRVFGSVEVGDHNLLAIRVLEQGVQIERHEREADEGEREIDRLRLALASEQSAGRAQIERLRAAMAEGATDAAQASALRDATITIVEGSRSDLGPDAVPMASALLAMHQQLQWALGVIIAAGNLFDENAMARAGAR